MIKINAVSKNYKSKEEAGIAALDSIDLFINKGDFVTVLGASGSGKSTLLFTIGGMLSPTAGSVLLNGEDIYALNLEERAAIRRQKIGFVFQTFNLVPYLTCLENVALPAILNGKNKAEAYGLAENMLRNIGLGERLSHSPAKLSVGERQRTAILRSLINEPDILLADEPTGNLDSENALEVIKIFKDLNTKGRTIVMVTHDRSLADIGNRTIRLRKGLVENDEQFVRVEVKA
jgi:putative ABC transport system ATP-binding protein